MASTATPGIRLLPESELGEDSYHSLLIALLRGLAAVQVAAAHLRSEFFPGLRTMADPPLAYQGLAFFTGFAHQAVILFFLISGWLVGGSLLNKLGRPHALKIYAIDRVTRLWTVLIPTFSLMLLFGLFAGELIPDTIDYSRSNNYSVISFVGNLFGLQTVTLSTFGGNYPLWSLANETWYYLMFPLLLVLIKAASATRRVLAMLALLAIALWLPYAMTLYFLIWLLGAIFSRIRIDCGNAGRAVLLAAFLAIAVYHRLTGINDDLVPEAFVQDLVLSIAFLLFLSSTQVKIKPQARLAAPLAKVGKFFAEFSFTLYVLHVPLIRMMQQIGTEMAGSYRLSPSEPLHYATYCGMLAAILVLAYTSYVFFESQTPKVRRWLKDVVFLRKLAPAAAER